jgi:alpha-methylacyl-CoA racemase
VGIDLKRAEGVEAVLRMVERADALVESYRPGVAERLGLGPDACRGRNPRLVYGRLTGWGQDGPLALRAGHDLNYVSLTGAVHAIGPSDGPPVPPLQILGDFAGGGLLLAYGVVCALFDAARTGQGQVVDAAMVDGVASFLAPYYGMVASGDWVERRGENLFDGGAPFYAVYATADGRYVSVAAIEPAFWAELLDGLGLAGDPAFAPERQWDRPAWPTMRARLAEVFATRSRDEWCDQFAGTDACLTPVLALGEVSSHPHHVARRTFVDGEVAPVPRLSRTPGAVRSSPDEEPADVLGSFGFTDAEAAHLVDAGIVTSG